MANVTGGKYPTSSSYGSTFCRRRLMMGECLFFVMRIHADGDRTIVDQRYFHVSPEFSCHDFFTKQLGQLVAEILIQGNRYLVTSCPQPTGTVALLVGSVKCKLAYYHHLAAYIGDGSVHNTLFVVKDTQTNGLFGQPVRIVLRIFLKN